MSVEISKFSRLQFAELISSDGVEYFDMLEAPEIEAQADDVQHFVLQTDRIDLLANHYYGTPVLWWVIAVANDLELVPSEFREGQTLRIPSPRYVLQELFKRAKR